MYGQPDVPKPYYKDITLFRNGDNPDIIKSLCAAFPFTYKDTAVFSKKFAARSLYDTGYNVWEWLRSEITYNEDGDHQQIRSVARMYSDGEGDCKSLGNAGTGIMAHYTEAGYRFVSYNRVKIPTHVYTIFKDESGNTVPLDACYKKFGAEKRYTYKWDKWMRISYLSGITVGNTPPQQNAFIKRYVAGQLTAAEQLQFNALTLYFQQLKKAKPGTALYRSLENKIQAIVKQFKQKGIADASDLGTGDNFDVSDPSSPDYDPSSDLYDPTLDPDNDQYQGTTEIETPAPAASTPTAPNSNTGSSVATDLAAGASLLAAADTGYELATGKKAAPLPTLHTQSSVGVNISFVPWLIGAAVLGYIILDN